MGIGEEETYKEVRLRERKRTRVRNRLEEMGQL